MAENTDRQKLSLFGPLVDSRSEGDEDSAGDEAASDDEEAPDDENSTAVERRPDAVPFFRHR